MNWFKLFAFGVLCCTALADSKGKGLQVVHQWKELEFVFPDEATKKRAIELKYYVPGASFQLDVDVHYWHGILDRIFVTFPRFDEGRPVTLGVVEEDGKIRGYPDYATNDNQGQNCNGISSVFRVAIDKCHRLWVMDTGKVGEIQSCSPQLLAYDLKTDQIIFRHRFPADHVKHSSLFVTPVVDMGTDCRGFKEVYVYVADTDGYGLIVVDVEKERSWRITNKLFESEKDNSTFTIEGESFSFMDGILGLALSPYKSHDEDRTLYFHALASITENKVKTSVIKDPIFIDDSAAYASSFHRLPGTRPNQAAPYAIDRDGIMYFGIMDPPSILCWNTATKFGQDNFHAVDINRQNLQFAGGVKIANGKFGIQELWVSTCRMQKIFSGTLVNTEINFRILKRRLSDLLKGSPCKNMSRGGHQHHHRHRRHHRYHHRHHYSNDD